MSVEVIKGLVERFAEHKGEYTSGAYNETLARRDFIDPFFEALGWDVLNKQGFSQTFRQVIHEDSLTVEGSTKAPDYCFQLGGRRIFFVEAKKPAVDLKESVHPAYQLRRYAWSAKLPVSILTDFQEFAVYDCCVKPAPSDKASTARIMYLGFDEYLSRWDELVGLLSPDAVQKGAIEKYIGGAKARKGTAEVDDAFLEEIEGWRESLAKSVALRNADLPTRDLNFAVQRTIDRIIFLRICEDRGIETYHTLWEFQNGANIYERLVEYFRRADERYNSGLFHFRDEKDQSEAPDTLTPRIKIDDKPLKDILKKLYYPECPYEFSVLGADILGSVYERFLGKVIRLTAGHRAVVEEKPEVRKAGGVYYTPTYIVDYIVKNTVGKLLEGKTVKQAADLRILDPACGSGSFLIGAYQHLLDWHVEQYAKAPDKWTRGQDPALYKTHKGEWRLTAQERKRILLNNIYGVDIDPQAVEVTKLSLLLKILEGETEGTIFRQRKMVTPYHQRALPDLGSNIKCGNSLIGPDFYQQQSMAELTDEEKDRISVFDWKGVFLEIMKRGGFDAVIGNPPYIFARDEGFSIIEKQYFQKFKHHSYQLNTFTLFTEQGFDCLGRNGYLGYIIPNNWLTIDTMKPFRDFIFSSTADTIILNFQFKVFIGANVDTSILIFRKSAPNNVQLQESSQMGEILNVASVQASKLLSAPTVQYSMHKNIGAKALLEKIERSSKPLMELATVKAGLKAYETGKGKPAQTDSMKKTRIYHSKEKQTSSHRIYLDGKDVKRYCAGWSGEYLKYGPNLAAPRDHELFEGDRILVRQIPSKPPHCINAVIISGEELNDINSMIIKVSDNNVLHMILGIINSRLISFWFCHKFDKFQRSIFPQFKVKELAIFPIKLPCDEKKKSALLGSTRDILELSKKAMNVRNPDKKNNMQRQIDATDRQIDQLVYELYGLTEKEIKIVEGAGSA